MKPRKISVFVWRDGRVEFGPTCPDEALPIATGPEDELRGVVEVLAERGNDGVLRISGVNVTGEARTAQEADKCLHAIWSFQDEVEAGMGRYRTQPLEACHA